AGREAVNRVSAFGGRKHPQEHYQHMVRSGIVLSTVRGDGRDGRLAYRIVGGTKDELREQFGRPGSQITQSTQGGQGSRWNRRFADSVVPAMLKQFDEFR